MLNYAQPNQSPQMDLV